LAVLLHPCLCVLASAHSVLRPGWPGLHHECSPGFCSPASVSHQPSWGSRRSPTSLILASLNSRSIPLPALCALALSSRGRGWRGAPASWMPRPELQGGPGGLPCLPLPRRGPESRCSQVQPCLRSGRAPAPTKLLGPQVPSGAGPPPPHHSHQDPSPPFVVPLTPTPSSPFTGPPRPLIPSTGIYCLLIMCRGRAKDEGGTQDCSEELMVRQGGQTHRIHRTGKTWAGAAVREGLLEGPEARW